MASYNRVVLIGNLTRDPQLSYLPSGTAVCDFGMAMNHRWRDKEGNQKDDTCFVDCQCFGRPGETINQYMRKGRSLLVEGRLRYRKWTDKEGQNRSKVDVFVENFTFLGQGPGGGPGAPAGAVNRGGSNDAPPPPTDDDYPQGNDPEIPF